MPTLIVIASTVLATNFQCVQHLDEQSSNPPVNAYVQRQNINLTLVELYGGHVVLRCEGKKYTAYLLEDEIF